MDFVYVCRSGDNEELRYSIRSILKNAKVKNIWVVGSKPDWYSGNFISVVDGWDKFDNIKNCIKAATSRNDVSDDFILMNDDFFIHRKLNEGLLYYGGDLYQRVHQYISITGYSDYAMSLYRTYDYLKDNGIDNPLNYDIHVPMKINKKNMQQVIDLPYSIRSLYGNIFNVGGENIKDVKVYGTPMFQEYSHDLDSDEVPFISCEDNSFDVLYDRILRDAFPIPSPYEN